MQISKLVSVVIPFYKELELIERAVSSVISQTLPPGCSVEVVIGNDGSYSESEIRSRLSVDQNAICTIVKNFGVNGAGNARNVAIDASRGDHIAFLDADDYWCENKLLRQLELIGSGASFVAGGYQFVGSASEIFAPQSIRDTADLLRKLRVSTSSVLLSRQLCGESRFTNLRFSQDTEFWARLAGKPGFKYAAVPSVVAMYAPSGRTSNKFVQAVAFRKVVRRFSVGPINRLEIYIRYATRGVLNHYLLR